MERFDTDPRSPQATLEKLRDKMEEVANEYADKKISRAQFNAIYGHYSEQRELIELLLSRNPSSDAWRSASAEGKTGFLRQHFAAQPSNYVIFAHHNQRPVMGGGDRPDMKRIMGILKSLWRMKKMHVGVARLALEKGRWLVFAVGKYSTTFVTYNLEPAGAQIETVHDLHKDFERANRLLFERKKIDKDQLVYPQRALLEQRNG